MTQRQLRRNLEQVAIDYLHSGSCENGQERRSIVMMYNKPCLNLNKKPWIDQWTFENAMKLYQPFPWTCDYPKPLLPPAKLPRTVYCKGDPGTDLLLTKKFIERDVEYLQEHIRTQLKDLNLSTKEIKPFEKKTDDEDERSETVLPRFVADMANLLDQDPDPDYNGRYNYYFNGGSLSCVTMGTENILLFPYVGELIAAPLTSHEGALWKPNLKRATKWQQKEQIFDIRHIPTDFGHQVMTRSKYQLDFFLLTEKGDKLTLKSACVREYNAGLMTADMNPFKRSEYCVISNDGFIRTRDIIKTKDGTGQRQRILSEPKQSDNWCSVKYQNWSPNIMTLTNRCCVNYIDTRESINKPILKMCPKDYMNADEEICLELPSDREQCHYVATYLNLFMMDSRYPTDPTQQKWTHNLESAPIFGNVITHGGREVITLSTQIVGDTKIVLNTWEDCEHPHNFHLPYQPPSILDTLRECHLLGKCLDPMMRERLKLSAAGSQLLFDDDDNIYYFTQNSVGDVFYQGLNYDEVLDKDSYVNTNAYYALDTWEKRMIEQRANYIVPLVMDDQANMKTLFEAFSNKELKYIPPKKYFYKDRELERGEKIGKKLPDKRRLNGKIPEEPAPFWKQSIKRLSQYTDLLAPTILAPWELTETEKELPQAGQAQKVLSWLEKAEDNIGDVQSTQESINDELDDCTIDFSQDLISVSQQEVQPDYRTDFEITEDFEDRRDPGELSYIFERPAKRRKEMKKKNNYNSGF